jgi:hypothetical protein
MSETAALALYDQLLASIGAHSAQIEPRLCVSHWPHVGSAYDGLLIVGQALRGWPNEWNASEAATEAGRRRILDVTKTHATSRSEPLDWIPQMKKVRNSPFWTFSRHLVELVTTGPAPWYARYAWANLYPVAPEDPPDNPGGALKEAQDPFVGPLLLELADMLEARTVVVIAGPIFWYHARRTGEFWNLAEAAKPLTWKGEAYGRRWVVGYHPQWASYQGWGAPRYAGLVAEALDISAAEHR